ncbi:MAG: DUF1573 domain-containing protein [Candidatus Liptonbacteria bacterium]|nr:DUF1573 domain-containing protein [Candidatus Liptonbacteria bacterium]
MKPLTLLIITAVVLGVGVWFARPNTAEPTTAALQSGSENSFLVAEEHAYDFGTIRMANGKVSREFRFTNAGTVPAALTQLFTSCMCTEATLVMIGREYGPFGMPGHGFGPRLDAVLEPGATAVVRVTFDPPGATAVVRVTFDPNAHGPAGVGPIQRVASLENDSSEPLEFVITGQVTP